MSLEQNVDYLGDLDPSSPGPAEFKSEGDDHLRNVKKALRQCFPGVTGPILAMGAATGAADAYVLTPARPLVEYKANMLVAFQVAAANATTAPTLNISSIGPKAIKAVDGSALVAGDLPANSYQFLVYNGTDFVLQAPTKGYVDRAIQALKEYADQLVFQENLPNQQGNAGKVLTTDGAVAGWQDPTSVLKRSLRTTNAALTKADRGSLVDITGGTFTQTFDAAATLGNGWWCYVRNSGTGQITIPASDGRTNWIMYPNECRVFQCDGAALLSIVIQAYRLVSQVAGNFIKPPGYNYHRVRGIGGGQGGGGGGGGASGNGTQGRASGNGGSGGAGGVSGVPSEAIFADAAVPNSVPFTPGAGGSGGNGGTGGAGTSNPDGTNGAVGNQGSAGNPTTFGIVGTSCYLVAAGAALSNNGGAPGNSVYPGSAIIGSGAAALSFDIAGTVVTNYPSTPGGNSTAGTAAVAGTSSSTSGAGGPGGTSSTSAATATVVSGGTGGASVSVIGTAGNNGVSVTTKAGIGCGGAGGGGGSGSAGAGSSGSVTSAKAGNGGNGGAGGDGQIEVTGII